MNQGSRLKEFVAYYRVSTKKQGRSGLGLEAQRELVERYAVRNGVLIAEFTDVESGKRDQRTGLQKAIKLVRTRKASLLIARLDRFSRRVSFIANMMDNGVALVIAEMPNASEFQLHIFAALAQEERRLISERTRSALQAAKARGQQLGTAGKERAKANREQADHKANEMVAALRNLPATCSYAEAAKALDKSGWRTATNCRPHPQTVKNYLLRLNLDLRQTYKIGL